MDLTKITTPYGLLDAETQKALREHGGPIEHWHYRIGWLPMPDAKFDAPELVYRVKPEPPMPREWWVNEYKNCMGELHSSRENADAVGSGRLRVIHVREVL